MGLDAEDKLKLEDAQGRFVRKDEPADIQKLGEAGIALARLLLETCPPGRERDIAVNHIEDALVYARTALGQSKGYHE